MTKIPSLICAAALAFGANASATPILSGFSQTTLDSADDASTKVDLAGGMKLTLNGSTYKSLYVNTNGNVSFGNTLTAYSPLPFSTSYELDFLAPYFGDADTRENAGEAAGSHGAVGHGYTQFAQHDAFVVTWANVGYYNKKNDKTATFQLVLVDRSDTGAGNFDFYYNYGALAWDKATGVNSARAGYHLTGTAADFEFSGSGIEGALLASGAQALAKGSNVGVDGRYGFTVRDGLVAQGIEQDADKTQVPLPGTFGLLGIGALALGFTRRRKA